MTYSFSANSIAHMVGVDERLPLVFMDAIKICPIDFGVPADGGKRLAERQHELFLAGLSRCDGYDKLSPHQLGTALDFYAYVDGAVSYESAHLAIVAATILQCGAARGIKLKWGGLFKPFKRTGNVAHGWDMPHIQLDE